MCVSLFAEVMTKSASNSPTYRMYGILFSRGFFFFQIPTTMMGHRLCVLKSMQKSQNYHTFPSQIIYSAAVSEQIKFNIVKSNLSDLNNIQRLN